MEQQFSDEAVALWQLQNAATAARALATMGDTVSSAIFQARQRNAETATKNYRDAMENATPEAMDAYAELLRYRLNAGMRD